MVQSKILSSKDLPTLTEQTSAVEVPTESKTPQTSETSLPGVEQTALDAQEKSSDSLRESLNALDILWRSMAILAAMGITIALYLTIGKDQIQRFQEYGYLGIFLTSLIGNASIALPIPSLFFTFVGGGTFNWVIVGLVSGIGEALGESTGYLAGYGGSAFIENQSLYKRMQHWMKKHGTLTIFVLSVIPNPIIDLAGIAAGASRFGYLRFLVACWAGKTIKTLIFAFAGAYSVNWMLNFVEGFIG
jgi:membrane protein DedA with SNARE-associated domain